MHHKRKGPKNTKRAGCIMCKPWKRVGCTTVDPRGQVRRQEEKARQELRENTQDGATLLRATED